MIRLLKETLWLKSKIGTSGTNISADVNSIKTKTDNLPANTSTELTTINTEVVEIERHIHNRGRWFGKSADQSGNDWCVPASTVGIPTVFRAVSGNADFGGDANDEAKLFGTSDACIAGDTKFDCHRLLIIDTSATTTYVLRIIYGSGTMADAINAGQYNELIVKRDTVVGEAHGNPIDVLMPRITIGTDKLWLQCKNTTDNAWIDFYFGGHSYPV